MTDRKEEILRASQEDQVAMAIRRQLHRLENIPPWASLPSHEQEPYLRAAIAALRLLAEPREPEVAGLMIQLPEASLGQPNPDLTFIPPTVGPPRSLRERLERARS